MTAEKDSSEPDIYSGELTHDADLGPESDEAATETTTDATEGESHE